jgi:hypothetical protein
MTNRYEGSWEHKLAQVTMPPMDVHDRVMEAVRRMERATVRERSVLVRGRAWMVPVLAVCILIGSGFAYVSHVLLNNDAGETVLSIRDYNSDHVPSPVTESEWAYYQSLTQPGETVLVYKAEDNPQKIISSYTNTEALLDYALLKNSAGAGYALPASLPQPFSFVEGHVIATVQPSPELLDDIYAEGEASGQTVTRIITTSQAEAVGVSLKLEQAGESYTASILDGEHADTWYTDLSRHADAEVITVFGTEGYLARVDGNQELYWKHGNGAGSLYYHLSTTDLSEQGEAALISLLEALAAGAVAGQ